MLLYPLATNIIAFMIISNETEYSAQEALKKSEALYGSIIKLEFYSKHDHLTGLYNRAFFEETLKCLHEENRYPISVLTADIDGLKLINDTMGYEKGNDLLLP